MQVVGLDGTKGGWVAVVLKDGRFSEDRLVFPIESTFDEFVDAEVLAIDVPIGFGARAADKSAREFLSGATSTVFSTPPREVLEHPFGPGLGVSAQAHALGPRILHITRLAERDLRIQEVHPEVCFRAMNERHPLRYRKKSAGGALERVELLRRQGIELSELRGAGTAPLDDVLDAAAAAWTAHRIACGIARSLPDSPEDVGGRKIAMWY